MGTVVDERDGQGYIWMTIGTRKWITENLKYKPDSGISHCYQSAGYPDAEANCAKYGRLYDWATAMNLGSKYEKYWWEGDASNHQGICPDGWRLPDTGDWKALLTFAGGASTAGTKLKAQSGWRRFIGNENEWYRDDNGTDDFGFSALPGGEMQGGSGSFEGIGGSGYWWAINQDKRVNDMGLRVTMYYIIAGAATVNSTHVLKNRELSVRCVAYTENFNVYVNSNGSTYPTGSGIYKMGDTVTVTAGTANDGKRFLNWTTQSGGVTLRDAKKDTTTFIMPANDVTLTAIFERKYSVTVVSIGVGAEGGGAYWEKDTVKIKAGTVEGVKFKMWTTQSNGVKLANANSETTSFIMPGNDVTVRAVFAEDKDTSYKIIFSAEGGEVFPEFGMTGADGKLDSLPTPTRNNGIFDGWYTTRASDGIMVDTSTRFTADTTIYARWTITGDKSYIVMWYTHGGTLLPVVTSVIHGGDINEPVSAGTRTGFAFGGWYLDSALTVPAEFPIIGVTEAMDFHAKWTPATVTFVLPEGGGTVSPSSMTVGTNGKLPYLPIPTPPVCLTCSYVFAFDGWYTTDSADGKKVDKSTVFKADTNVYGRWTPVATKYTITFNPNGGTVNPTTVLVGPDGKLPFLPTPKREGFVFDGWYTAKTGGKKVTESYVFKKDAEVFARWIAFYVIKFDANGGTVSRAADTTGLDGKLASPLPVPERNSYAFDGWYTSREGGAMVTASYVFSGNTTLYAHWTPVALFYTITFNPNGGVAVNPPTRVTLGNGTLASLPVPTRSGYSFDGWYTSREGGTRVTTNYVFGGNATIYAHWRFVAVSYTVTFGAGAGGRLIVTVDGVPITPGASVDSGKIIVFTAIPNDGYRVSGWKINGTEVADTIAMYVLAGLSSASTVTVTFERRSSAAPSALEVPSVAAARRKTAAQTSSGAVVTFHSGANGALTATVDGVPIVSGGMVAVGKNVVFTAVPSPGYGNVRWWVNDKALNEPSSMYTIMLGISNAAPLDVAATFEIYVAPPGAQPSYTPYKSVDALFGRLTFGPSPVRSGDAVAIYWAGNKEISGDLQVYNVYGDKVAVVKDLNGVGKIGEWNTKGVANGTYLATGMLKDKDGIKCRVWMLIGVVR
jgi:uncharacterized protein (TIGR02145 family)/uncharacterized repeat protein (TIGR02543 family)